MAIFSIPNTKIAGISAVIPKQRASNFDLKGLSDTEIQLLVKTTGIEERRIADKHTCASDLCLLAAEKLLTELEWERSEIEVLIFVTQTPDYTIPGTSMSLQQRLGLSKKCMALDINQGCAGYVYGLSTIAGLLSSSGLKKGLLLVGDTITKLLREGDNSTVPIFSDAGTATALEFDSDAAKMHFNLQTDGSKYNAIIMPESGHRKPEEGYDSNACLAMRGHDVFTFGLKEVAPNLEELLTFCDQDKEKVDHYIFHQANLLLNESIRKKLHIPTEKVPITLSKYGNTSCATIPLTIVSEMAQIVGGTQLKIAMSGFGVGLSWGSALINISDIKCPKLIEF